MGQFKASKELTGKRLDEALFAFGAAKSRSKCQALIKQGKVAVNGKPEKAHYPLEEGDVVLALSPQGSSLMSAMGME